MLTDNEASRRFIVPVYRALDILEDYLIYLADEDLDEQINQLTIARTAIYKLLPEE